MNSLARSLEPAAALVSVTPVSTMTRLDICQAAIDTLGAQTYLEIGVSYGEGFLRTKCPRKIAVDPYFTIPLSRKIRHVLTNRGAAYCEQTSDAFFAGPAATLFGRHGKIDVAFVDGLHTYEQSLRDVENCLQWLSPNGVIVMHDCNPVTREAEQSDASGDVWKAVVHLRTRSDLRVAVLDCDQGVGIVRRGHSSPLLVKPAQIPAMTWDDLEAHRVAWLNLQPPSALTSLLA
jgi:hypothetical protein